MSGNTGAWVYVCVCYPNATNLKIGRNITVNKCTVDRWTAQVWTVCACVCFSNKYSLPHLSSVSHLQIKQWWKPAFSHSQLQIPSCRFATANLKYCFLSMVGWIPSCLGPAVVKFWGSQVICKFSTPNSVGSHNPNIVQGSTVLFKKWFFSSL